MGNQYLHTYKTMKAVQLTAPGKALELREIPVPEIGNREILIQVKAAGICHSDAHYRKNISPDRTLPLTLGHEVAGMVVKIGSEVKNVKIGDRVALHYLVTCGDCHYCAMGREQFCKEAQMLGNHIHGGYGEYIAIPARNAIHLPETISFEEGATLMCASATSFHALLKGRIQPGESVAVFGVGGLGQSAVQLAKAFGATQVYAVDINPKKLALAKEYGAIPINAKEIDPVEEIKKLTKGMGVAITLELIGLPLTQKQALQCAGPMGRVVFVGLSKEDIAINPYYDILGNEVELIGSNDHNLKELPTLVEFAEKRMLDTSKVVSKTIPLDADLINQALDELETFGDAVRTVIVM